MDAKLKHLEFIQSAVNRMANNSFLLKGWAVAIAGALLTFSFKELNPRYVLVSLIAIASFWLLDGYYLSRERLFIKLYDHTRKIENAKIDFSMDTSSFRRRWGWLECAVSITQLLFYGGLFLVHDLVLISLAFGD